VAIAYVNGSYSEVNYSDASSVAAPALSAVGGNALIAIVESIKLGSTFVGISSVTDTAGNTYTRAGSVDQGTASGYSFTWEFWIATGISGNASNIVTANLADVASVQQIFVVQYSGLAASAYDTQSALVITSEVTTTHTSGSLVTSQANELLIGRFLPWDYVPLSSVEAGANKDHSPLTACTAIPLFFARCIISNI